MHPEPPLPRSQPKSAAPEQLGMEVDAVLATSRALVGVAARSLAPVEDRVSVSQFRALVIIASRGPLHSAALAQAMGLHPSNATRTCDRLVALALLDRRDDPADRRHLLLTLTPAGSKLVQSVTIRRRGAIRNILRRMPVADRQQLATAFAAFALASGEPTESELWALGWVTDTPTPEVAMPQPASPLQS